MPVVDWSLLVAIAAAAGAIANAVVLRKQTRELRRQHEENREEDRQRNSQQIAALSAELEESKRQWEESGAVIEIDGRYEDHPVERPLDTLTLTIRNVGRMPAYVTEVRVFDVGDLRGQVIRPTNESGSPLQLDPGSSHELTIERGVARSDQFSAWKDAVVRVVTGDGREVLWDKEHGMDVDISEWP